MALSSRQALIVLDGTEAADDLTEILSITGGFGVLITTRRHSDAPADFCDMPPLPLAEAVQLLQSWAGTMASDEKICQSIVAFWAVCPWPSSWRAATWLTSGSLVASILPGWRRRLWKLCIRESESIGASLS
jgi:hypothetical protein